MGRVRQQLFGEAVRIEDGDILRAESTKASETKDEAKDTITQDHPRPLPPGHRPIANTNSRLLQLPMELQLMILKKLTFGQIETLRRTCRYLRSQISKPVIRELFPGLRFELLSTCFRCLCYDPLRSRLIRADESDARYPLANECVSCVAARGGFTIGRRYTLATWATVSVCRYCGYPITGDPVWNEPEFHHGCYKRFRKVLFYYFLVGCAQSAASIIGAALCWSYFRHEVLVLAPTIVNFFMGIWVFILTLVRNLELRTYHWALILELGILALWSPPLKTIVDNTRETPGKLSKADIATISFIAINMAFRLLNILGNIILVTEYEFWDRFRPDKSRIRRFLKQVIAFLVFWTYPQSVEQSYPGKWWFTKREPRPWEA
ncbi:hypothetical protein FDECE_1764 [Fusarium decemcellulare]|nr:hypothetical protein FDECE_1764 [Fusarium decemcellulare]